MLELLVLLLLGFLLLWWALDTRKPFNYPPGPNFKPFLGNVAELKLLSKSLNGQHLALWELAKEYKTKVLGLKLGRDLVITVFGYDTVKMVLTGEEFEGRPDNFFMKLRCMGTRRGVTCTDGDFWKTQRNFVTSHLRSLGFGKKPMELMVKEEIQEILHKIQENPTRQIGQVLSPAILNILWALTTGQRISPEDQRLTTLLELLSIRSKAFDMSGGTLSQYPWLRHFAPDKTGFTLVKKLNQKLKEFVMETIQEHYHNWSEEQSQDDLIYSFITEMKKGEESFSEDQLIMICLDIFIAGSQTTSNTLDFAFMMMLLHPKIQRKVQETLDKNFDGNSNLEYSDRHLVPYVEACLLEVIRYCHVTPICGPRRVLKNTTLEQYNIPKDSTILISLYSIHHDPDYWTNPEEFNPERFLDDNGKISIPERLVPFGLGRRRCLGELLARNSIFMIFTEVLRNFTIEPEGPLPTGIPLPGITLSPEKYTAKFTKRNK